MPRYFFHGLFKKKSDATTRAGKLKREGAKVQVVARKARNGATAYLVRTVSTIRGR